MYGSKHAGTGTTTLALLKVNLIMNRRHALTSIDHCTRCQWTSFNSSRLMRHWSVTHPIQYSFSKYSKSKLKSPAHPMPENCHIVQKTFEMHFPHKNICILSQTSLIFVPKLRFTISQRSVRYWLGAAERPTRLYLNPDVTRPQGAKDIATWSDTPHPPLIKFLRPNDKYMQEWTKPSYFQIMDCRLSVTEPLSKDIAKVLLIMPRGTNFSEI